MRTRIGSTIAVAAAVIGLTAGFASSFADAGGSRITKSKAAVKLVQLPAPNGRISK